MLTEFSKTYKPFLYPWAVELTKKHEEIHWVEDEAELSEDVQDWRTKLTDSEKEFVTQVLRLFTQSDVQVGENYHELLIPRFKNNEVRNMLSSFANREGVHQRAYALLNDTLGLPEEDFHKFIEMGFPKRDAVPTNGSIGNKELDTLWERHLSNKSRGLRMASC